ncbi:MAG: SPOR domain-containing protein [Silicimonas sp.]|nr:SPOR domain-containing protein [Silicimonas sp.]
MAAINYHDYGGTPRGNSLTAALNWLGAFLSLLLIVGLGVWGWKLWVRDVTGVPVVRALEGPMRVAPEEPGGLASNYQGLTVNRIAEEQVDVAPADRVVLAPQPTLLDEEEDLAMAALPPVTPEAAPAAPEAATAQPEIGEALVIVNEAPALAVIEEAPAQVEPDKAADLSATDLAVQLALGLNDKSAGSDVVAAAHVPVRTPRPLGRPSTLRVSAPAPASAPATVGAPQGATPTRVAPGTRLVQLGAYGDRDVARVEWENRKARFGDYMVGKTPLVQEAATGGRTFYRLRAMGFDDLAEARRFCAVLVAEGVTCIPTVQD